MAGISVSYKTLIWVQPVPRQRLSSRWPQSQALFHIWQFKRKNINFHFIGYAKAFDCVNHTHTHTHTNCGKFLKRWEYQTVFPASWEICMQVKKQQLELNMNNGQVQNWRKAIYCHPASLTYMQSTSCKMLGWMTLKLESRLLGEISTTLAMQVRHP